MGVKKKKNARSFIQKRSHLIIHVITENPDFILITETWLNMRDKYQLSEVAIKGYNAFAKCRLHKKKGGV